jgi:hypothetical protein
MERPKLGGARVRVAVATILVVLQGLALAPAGSTIERIAQTTRRPATLTIAVSLEIDTSR